MKRFRFGLLSLALSAVLAFSGQVAKADNPAVRLNSAPVALNLETLAQQVAYPSLMRDMGVQGIVVIKVRVDENGTVSQAEVLSTPNPALAQSCLHALPNLRFQPAQVDGQATAAWVTIPFRFQL